MSQITEFAPFTAAVIAVGVAFYAFGPYPPFWVKSAIAESLSDRFVDPDSLKFKDLRYSSKDSDVVCGNVNAKNRMGAYTGYIAFAYLRTQEYAFIEDESAPGSALVATLGCSSKD